MKLMKALGLIEDEDEQRPERPSLGQQVALTRRGRDFVLRLGARGGPKVCRKSTKLEHKSGFTGTFPKQGA